MFDLLVSTSVVVDDLPGAVERVSEGLGMPEPRPTWFAPAPGLEAVFCRVHPSMAVAPTRFELIAPAPITEPDVPIRFYVPEIVERQGDRPIKAHATALATSRQSEVIERLRRAGVRHRVDPALPGYWPLVWLGVSENEPAAYDPAVDGGLMVEVVATESLRLPPETFDGDPGVPEGLPAGAMVRVAARGFLVGDLDAASRALEENLGWETAGPSQTVAAEGYRCVDMAFGLPHSAAVQLIEPIADGPAADFMTRWGPGPYNTRITVTDLDAKAEDLRRRGTAFATVPAADGPPGPMLRVFDTKLVGALVEFVAHRDQYPG